MPLIFPFIINKKLPRISKALAFDVGYTLTPVFKIISVIMFVLITVIVLCYVASAY